MRYFTKNTVDFWRGLAANNTKSWFDDNRQKYEEHLREPYRRLAADLVHEIRDREPEYEIEPKQATYRINRDVRFSEDKTPYKTELGITIGRTQKHDPSYPAYTVRLSVEGVSIAGGMYAPAPALRDHLRRHVAHNSAELQELATSEPFVGYFGSIQGDKGKRIPKELVEHGQREPLTYNKQWVYWAGYDDPEMLLSEDLGGVILDHWEAARPVNEYFKTAVATYEHD